MNPKGNKTLEQQLLTAVKAGKLDTVTELIAVGADINAHDPCNITMLMWAAIKEYTKIANVLIESGADVNQADYNQLTPLHIAADKGKTRLVKLLIKAGADINAVNLCNEIPVLLALKKDHYKTARVFIKAGFNINAVDCDKGTILNRMVWEENTSAVDFLILMGADVNKPNRYSSYPLHMAAFNYNIYIMFALVKAGADLYIKDSKGTTPLNLLKDACDTIHYKYKNNLIALYNTVQTKRLNEEDSNKAINTGYEYDI